MRNRQALSRRIISRLLRDGILAVLTGASGLSVARAFASEASNHCCSHCRANLQCRRICRLVREDKKVTITCWGSESEDFCVPGPSQQKCEHCENVCTCDKKSEEQQKVCSQPKRWIWREWQPSPTAKIFTRKKLMKRTETKTVPGYKWVVENLCSACASSCSDAEIVPGADVPPKPTDLR